MEVEAVGGLVDPVGLVLIPAQVGGEGPAVGHAHLGEVEQLLHRVALLDELGGVESEELQHPIHDTLPHVALLRQGQPLEQALELGRGECVGDELGVGLQAMQDGRTGHALLLGEDVGHLAQLGDAGRCGALGGRAGVGQHIDRRPVQELVEENVGQAAAVVLVEVEDDGVGVAIIESGKSIIHFHHNQINGADIVPGTGE